MLLVEVRGEKEQLLPANFAVGSARPPSLECIGRQAIGHGDAR
jgi:hypothetical protein